jgi:hypothetical protein
VPEQQMRRMEAVRAGSRWLYAEPTEDQVKEWFEKQPLHHDMAHGPYLGGIVIIPQTETAKVTMLNANDQMFVREEERTTYTPYVKVDTRVAYFWDLVDALNTEEMDQKYIGIIRPVPVPRVEDPSSAFYNGHLPDGYSVHAIRNRNDTINRYLVATWECLICERQSWKEQRDGAPLNCVLRGRGVKQVPTNYRNGWADDAALMKAETGAIGRALGVAGILVVGTGVATAEDIQEAVSGGGGETPATEPKLPPVVDREGAPVAAEGAQEPLAADTVAEETPEQEEAARERTDEELRAYASELRDKLQAASPEAWQAYVEWWQGRDFGKLEDLAGPALKGAVVKLERDLDAAAGGPA